MPIPNEIFRTTAVSPYATMRSQHRSVDRLFASFSALKVAQKLKILLGDFITQIGAVPRRLIKFIREGEDFSAWANNATQGSWSRQLLGLPAAAN